MEIIIYIFIALLICIAIDNIFSDARSKKKYRNFVKKMDESEKILDDSIDKLKNRKL